MSSRTLAYASGSQAPPPNSSSVAFPYSILDRSRPAPTIRRTMVGFSLPLLLTLVAACGIMMLLEWRGLPTTLSLQFKGDIKRESRWLAQYGQAVCTVVAGVRVWQLDGHRERAVAVLAAPFATTLVATVLKK